MKTLTHTELDNLLIDQPVDLSYDRNDDDAVVSIHKNDAGANNWFALPIPEQLAAESSVCIPLFSNSYSPPEA